MIIIILNLTEYGPDNENMTGHYGRDLFMSQEEDDNGTQQEAHDVLRCVWLKMSGITIVLHNCFFFFFFNGTFE